MLRVAAARPAQDRVTAMRTSNRDRISPETQGRAELPENPAALVIQEARRTRACRARAARAAEAGQAAVDRVAREAQADRTTAADQAARARLSTKRKEVHLRVHLFSDSLNSLGATRADRQPHEKRPSGRGLKIFASSGIDRQRRGIAAVENVLDSHRYRQGEGACIP